MSSAAQVSKWLPPSPRRVVLLAALFALAVGMVAFVLQWRVRPRGGLAGALRKLLILDVPGPGRDLVGDHFSHRARELDCGSQSRRPCLRPLPTLRDRGLRVSISGARLLMPWLHFSVGDERWWLNAPFLWLRDGAAMVVVWGAEPALRAHLPAGRPRPARQPARGESPPFRGGRGGAVRLWVALFPAGF